MTAPFTDVDAAVAEGHFIQHSLNKTAYIVCDDKSLLFVLTDDQYSRDKWCGFAVLEIFHPGGCHENKRVFSKPT